MFRRTFSAQADPNPSQPLNDLEATKQTTTLRKNADQGPALSEGDLQSFERFKFLSNRSFSLAFGTFLRTRNFDEFIVWWREHFPNPSGFHYNNLLLALSFTEDIDTMYRLFAEMKTIPGCEPNTKTYNNFIYILGRLGRLDEMKQMWEEMRTSNIEPNMGTFHSLIGSAARFHHLPDMEEYLQHMIESGIPVTAQTLASLLTGYAQAHKLDKMLNCYQQLTSPPFNVIPTQHIFGVIFEALGRLGKSQEITSWFQEMKRQGLVPDERIYNALISACSRRGDLEQMQAYYEQLEKDIVQPRYRIALTAVLQGYIAYGRYHQVIEVLKLFEKHNVAILPKTAFSMEGAFKQRTSPTDWQMFSQLLGLIKDRFMYGEKELRAESIILQREDCPPAYALALQTYLRSGNTEEFLNWWRTNIQNPTIQNYLDLIRVLAKRHDANNIVHFFSEMKSRPDYQPDPLLYNIAIATFGHLGRFEEIKQIWAEMKKNNITPTDATFVSVFSSCALWDNFHLFGEYYQEMLALFNPPLRGTLSAILRVLMQKRDPDSVLTWFHHLTTFPYKLRPTEAVIGRLTEWLRRRDKIDEMLRIYKEMDTYKVRPTTNICNHLIYALGRQGNFEQMQRLYEDMQKRGVNPDSATFNQFVWSYTRYGHYDQVLQVLQTMQQQGMAVDKWTVETFKRAMAEAGEQMPQRERFVALLDSLSNQVAGTTTQ